MGGGGSGRSQTCPGAMVEREFSPGPGDAAGILGRKVS